MNQKEYDYWKTVTASSEHLWVEDAITRLNDRGLLYYTGGEAGIFMRITPNGMFRIGTYESALPHIGEAVLTVKAEKNCSNINEAFQLACQLGGMKFLRDMFSNDQIPQDAGEMMQQGPVM